MPKSARRKKWQDRLWLILMERFAGEYRVMLLPRGTLDRSMKRLTRSMRTWRRYGSEMKKLRQDFPEYYKRRRGDA